MTLPCSILILQIPSGAYGWGSFMGLLMFWLGISKPAFRYSIRKNSRAMLFVVSLLLAAILTDPRFVSAQTRTGNVTQFKLENYGWQSLPEQPLEWSGTRARVVSIDHNGRVLVGFTARENQSLASREHPGLSFHILRFTTEGKVDLSLVLPTDNWFSNGFYLGSDDHIYARVNNALQFLSGEPDARNPGPVWKTLLSCATNCWINQSPSRHTLIVRDLQGPGHYVYTVLDVSSSIPSVAQSCPGIALNAETITDKFAYQSTDGISFDARRWPLCDPEHDTELSLDMRNGMISPLSNEALVLLGTGKDSRGVELVAADGQTKFRREMPKYDMVFDPVRSDERGDRFAFTVQTWRGGSRTLDIGGKMVARRVVAYSESGEQLATVPVNPIGNPFRYQQDFDFSISPDGHRLAVLDEGVLTVVDME